MKMKKLSAVMAAVIALGCTGAFPAEARSQIDTTDLPTLFSSKDDEAAILKFQKTKPKLSAENREYDCYTTFENRTLNWQPVDNALLYYIYAKPTGKKSYEKIGATYDTSYYVTYNATTTYCIRAISYDDNDTKIASRSSNAITLKFRANREKICETYDEAADYESAEGSDGGYDSGYAYDTAAAGSVRKNEAYLPYYPNTEEYAHTEENSYRNAATDPVSTFSADVDTASYANIRRLINDGCAIPEDAVRIEEMINYFDYDYENGGKYTRDLDTFSVYSEIADCPWNDDAKLLQLGITAKAPDVVPSSNLVFLVDVSGSMDSKDKLPLVKQSIEILAENMKGDDKISIVTYSGEERIILAGAEAYCKNAITDIVSCMEANGCTNGEKGINAAYEIAEKNFINNGNNRIILCTDGDLNVGISDTDQLRKLIEKKRESGVYFTVLGYGKGNIKDDKMEVLADNGNGSYHYIDSYFEAEKVLIAERTQNVITAAKDVKIQAEFNPAKVESYRLIGYDNRRLENSDFVNDSKDAGEIGAGQSITVLYEIIPAKTSAKKSSLKYQKSTGSDEWCNLKIRYKSPEETMSKELTAAVDNSFYHKMPSSRMKLASAAAMFGMCLKDSDYKGTSSPEVAAELLTKYDEHFREQNLGLLALIAAYYDL